MKILALDLGLQRIGVAVSDGKVVGSLPVIESGDRQAAVQQISKICREENIEVIVLGLSPNESTENADMVRSFALEINKMLPIPIKYIDESFTSKEAERLLASSKFDPKSKEYKQEVDKLSAKIILEQYLQEYE
jgi:putative Holliday junction resolvase